MACMDKISNLNFTVSIKMIQVIYQLFRWCYLEPMCGWYLCNKLNYMLS